jgi:hypothetical protein
MNDGCISQLASLNAQELTPYRFEFKCNTSRKRKYFLFMPRFEPGSLGLTMDALANYARPPLLMP